MAVSFVTYADLVRDCDALASRLLRERNAPDVIIGVPRSGMLPATILAEKLHCRLTTVGEFASGVDASGGDRIAGKPASDASVMLVDDSIYTGKAILGALDAVLRVLPRESKLNVCGVYATNAVQSVVEDIAAKAGAAGSRVRATHGRIVPPERYFEWNLWHHPDVSNMMFDLDGVLCEDPPEVERDDGDGLRRYEDWMDVAIPLVCPSVAIGAIVTLRLEKYRDKTRRWLDRHGIRCKRLYMSPYETAEERRRGMGYGEYKARFYADSYSPLFVESSDEQAREIAKHSGKPCLSWEKKVVHQ